MTQPELHTVTGAFGYSGRAIAERLLSQGRSVVTLTNSSHKPDPFSGQVAAKPLCFERPDELTAALEDTQVLYNTYWVRFNHSRFSHQQAVENTRVLFGCAAEAGVRHVVHVSITNPDLRSPFEYFRAKAELEQALGESGLSHTIVRPAVLFGRDGILINNIAWFLRRFPVFLLPGDGGYGIAPIFVEDFAELCVGAGADRQQGVVNAVGPETFTFRELVFELARVLGRRRLVLPAPAWLARLASRVVGRLLRDVVLTREEVGALMAGTLAVASPPTGWTALTTWAHDRREELGRTYASELARRR